MHVGTLPVGPTNQYSYSKYNCITGSVTLRSGEKTSVMVYRPDWQAYQKVLLSQPGEAEKTAATAALLLRARQIGGVLAPRFETLKGGNVAAMILDIMQPTPKRVTVTPEVADSARVLIAEGRVKEATTLLQQNAIFEHERLKTPKRRCK